MLKNTVPYFAPTDTIFLELIAMYENYIGLNRLWMKKKEKEKNILRL